jgi:6-phosphogluconolactonase/glucosamine-6-phosphate isomerase/deaminase
MQRIDGGALSIALSGGSTPKPLIRHPERSEGSQDTMQFAS